MDLESFSKLFRDLRISFVCFLDRDFDLLSLFAFVMITMYSAEHDHRQKVSTICVIHVRECADLVFREMWLETMYSLVLTALKMNKC